MKTMLTILTLSVLGILLVTACAQQTPTPTDVPSPPPTTASTPAGPTAEVSTAVASSGPILSSTQGATSQPLTEVTPNTPAPGATSEGQKVVTRDDQGKTITMHTGDSFLLQLGEQYTWDISISDQNVLSRVINIAVVKGAQGVYTAHQPGTVTLTANGDPLCRQSQPPCMMPSIAFRITVIVK